MKYAQFLEASRILEQQGLTFNDIKDKNVEELNEIFGINNAIKSLAVKGVWAKKLENNRKKLLTDLTKSVKGSIGKLVQAKKNAGDNKQLNLEIESKIIRIINSQADRLSSLKTKELQRRIENNKSMKDSAKDALLYTWELMVSEVKVNILTMIMDQDIIQSDVYKEQLKSKAQEKAKEFAEKEEKIKDEVENAGDEEITPDDIDDIIDDGNYNDKLKNLSFD